MKKGITLTAEQVREHQARHGFGDPMSGSMTTAGAPRKLDSGQPRASVLPKSRMNKVETEFSLILEAQKRKGEILDWKFEGMTLRLADQCKFTPDFFVLVSAEPLVIRFCETKGSHIWDDSRVKFKIAREQFPWAEWEMHQKKQGQWTRIA